MPEPLHPYQAYSIVVELSEPELIEFHKWADNPDRIVPGSVVEKVAHQVALTLPKPYYPRVGDWVARGDGAPGKVVGKLSDTIPTWVVEFAFDTGEGFYTENLLATEIAPY